jgi:hypothetical protein
MMPQGRAGWDPLSRSIFWDLAITTAGFLMTVAAVLLTLDVLSVG